MMKSRENRKRNIQWIAYAIVMLTLLIKIVLFILGVSQSLAYSTLDLISWTGLGLGVILLLISYLLPRNA
jgi:divalent metal cation (Fe/Co/Zn/Cd) transporter